MPIKLTYACPEKWENMKVGQIARYCELCSKHVHDFTQMSREEIFNYFIQNKGQEVCGRIYSSQLDYSYTERVIIIESLIQKHKNSNLAFYILSLGSLALVACNNTPTTTKQATKQNDDVEYNIWPGCENKSQDRPENTEPVVMGMITIPVPDSLSKNYNPADTIISPDEPRTIVETMPEFKGGIDGLTKYMQEHIQYPEPEKSKGVEGTVYVTFVVNRHGKAINPEILLNVKTTENFNKEVLRIVSAMPRWKPGKEKGKNVAVRMNLPVRFTLK